MGVPTAHWRHVAPLLLAVGLACLLALGAPSGADGDAELPTDDTSTTTGTEPTSTTDPGSTSEPPSSIVATTTTRVRSTTTTTTIDRVLPEQEDDPEFHLLDLVGEDYKDQPAFDPRTSEVIRDAVDASRAELDALAGRYESTRDDLARGETALRLLEDSLASLTDEQRAALSDTDDAQTRFEERAVDAYIRGNSPAAANLFASEDANALIMRTALIEALLVDDHDALEEFLELRDGLGADLESLYVERDDLARRVGAARRDAASLRLALLETRLEHSAWEAGSQVVVDGFVFPVFGACTFGDSWGAPRMSGTRYAHWHQGTDVLAAPGTPLVAVEDGVIGRVASDVLGGQGITMRGEGGLEFYYAHLSAYAPGIAPGVKVEAGQVIGFVGATGNAVNAHLHFEIHQNGTAVDPYPLLHVAWEQQGSFIVDAAASLPAP